MRAKKQEMTKALAVDVPRMKLSESGFVGLKLANGRVYEDTKKELLFPNCVKVYAQMQYDPTIAAALSLYDMMFAASKWDVRVKPGASEEAKERAVFIKQCMQDMKHSWRDFIQEAGSMVPYGFSVHEKVYRRRLKSSGSKYDDGLIGWAKLAPRSQDTIWQWIYSEDERDLIALKQSTIGLANTNLAKGSEVIIPRKKFLLFRTGKHKDNPEGESVLKAVYTPWMYRCAIEETEAIGVQRDLSGLPVISIPPQYMAADASEDQKAVYEYYKKIIRNIQTNEQSGLVLPLAYDPDTKQPLFKFDLIGSEGRKNFDTNEIIRRYDNKILTMLGADSLILGQSSNGSFSLAETKQNLINLNVASKLQEIADVLNNDLVPQTYELNGWEYNDDDAPEIFFDALGDDDLEQMSKYYQRVASVGLLERDRAVLNKIRAGMGIDPLPDDLPPQEDILTGNTSKSGQGMQTPFEGTRTSSGEGNDNDSNMDNVS